MKDLFDILIAFAGVGALTFGGGYSMLPLLQKNIATKRKWVTQEELADCFAVAQCLPGIIAINTAALIGYRRRRVPGMLAAALGVMLPSVLVILVIASFIQNFLQYEWVRHAFNGIRVAVLVLITDAVIKLWKNGVKDVFGIIIFTAVLLLLTFTSISPVAPLLAGAACGIILRERTYRHAKDNPDA